MAKKYFGENSTNFLIAILKSELEDKISVGNIANNFETDDPSKVLSASKGKELYDMCKDLTNIDPDDIKALIGCYCTETANVNGGTTVTFYEDSDHLKPISLVSGKFYLDFHTTKVYLSLNGMIINIYEPESELTDDEIYVMWYDGSFMFNISDENGVYHLVSLKDTTWGDWLESDLNNGNFSSDNLGHVLMGVNHVGYIESDIFKPLFISDIVLPNVEYVISITYNHENSRTLKIVTNAGSRVKVEKIDSSNESYVDPNPIIIESSKEEEMISLVFGTYKVSSTTTFDEIDVITNTETVTIGDEEVVSIVTIANTKPLRGTIQLTTNIGSRVKVEKIDSSNESYVDPNPIIIESTTNESQSFDVILGTYKVTSTTTFDTNDVTNDEIIEVAIANNVYAITITNEAPVVATKYTVKITSDIGTSYKIEKTKSDDETYVDPNPINIEATTEAETSVELTDIGTYKITATKDEVDKTESITVVEGTQEYTVTFDFTAA